jgi:hypothetical protein
VAWRISALLACRDGEALAWDVCKTERREILEALRDGYPAEWRIVDLEVNWEDDALFCAHTDVKDRKRLWRRLESGRPSGRLFFCASVAYAPLAW